MKATALHLLVVGMIVAVSALVVRADPINISWSSEVSDHPQIVYDDLDSSLHVFWIEEAYPNQVRHRQLEPWSSVEIISDPTAAVFNLDIYTDLEGNSYIAWTESWGFFDSIVVARYHGGWQETYRLPAPTSPVIDLAVACDPEGSLRLGWIFCDYYDVSVWYADYDGSWEVHEVAGYPDYGYLNEAPPQIGLGLGDNQQPILVWLLMSFYDTSGVFFSVRENGEWSEPGRIGDELAPFRLSITDDGWGKTFVTIADDFYA